MHSLQAMLQLRPIFFFMDVAVDMYGKPGIGISIQVYLINPNVINT